VAATAVPQARPIRAARRRVRGKTGPVRYVVDRYVPSRRVRFRFTAPQGFHGFHGFEFEMNNEVATLRHVLEMDVSGLALFSWPLLFRPLHDALIEDALTIAQGKDLPSGEWSRYVKVLRRIMARSGSAAETQAVRAPRQ